MDSGHSAHLLRQLLFLIILKLHVPLGQAGVACPLLDEDEVNHGDPHLDPSSPGPMASGQLWLWQLLGWWWGGFNFFLKDENSCLLEASYRLVDRNTHPVKSVVCCMVINIKGKSN